MINTRKKIGVTPSEVVEDRAAKDFRSAVREKKEYKEQRQNARFAYAVSIALVIVVLVIGVSTINNYDKMEAVQNTLETLSQSVTRPQTKETQVEEAVSSNITEKKDEEKEVEIKNDTVEIKDEDKPQGDEEPEEQKEVQPEQQTEMTDSGSQSGGQSYYIVQKGDTLDKISIKIYGNRSSVDAICRANGLADGNLIIIGQKLLLP